MHIDMSTAHGATGGKQPPDLADAMSMLRSTLEQAGLIQIKVEPNYVVLAALKALNDAGYTIANGSSINLSRPIRREDQTLLSQAHMETLERLAEEAGTPASDLAIARVQPFYSSYLVDNAISYAMAQQMRAVDAMTLATVMAEMGRLTTRVIYMIGTSGQWGLPKDATISDLVLCALNYYHNAWYRRAWRWFSSLFSPTQSETPRGDN
jgi:hypothetical protein